MLGEQEKPKIIDNTALDPDWLTARYKMEKREMWWDTNQKARYDRNFCGTLVNIFYFFILLTELILWIKVLLHWRGTETPGLSIMIALPLLLPSLILPVLAVLHSLIRGRLSYSSACLLILPPAPIALHFLIFYRKLQGEDHSRLSKAARTAAFVQTLVTSLPLVLVSLVTLLRSSIGDEMVDMTDLHRHLNDHSLQGLAASVSLLNLVVTTLRFNERHTGRAVTLLVGFPFLFTNIAFRLLGFSLLFCYFDTVWIFLCLGLLLCISALSVQLSARESLCVRLCKSMVGDRSPDSRDPSIQDGAKESVMDGVAGLLILSLANVFIPCGYGVNSRGWRLLVGCWLGSIIVHGMVMNHTVMSHIPNTYTGLAPVDLSMIIPKTGLAVNIPKMAGGVDLKLVLPRTEMKMAGDHPASYQINTSHTQDLVAAIGVPLLLVLLTVPFTFLRVMLLGWNCALTRQSFPDQDEEDDIRPSKASRSRNFLTVCCGVTGMMMFTMILVLVVAVYIFVIVQSVMSPLTKDPSD